MFARTVLFLIIFLLPTQLGFHFWPQWSYLAGFRIDYLSPTIYLVDLFLLIYLFINTAILKQNLLSLFVKNKIFFTVALLVICSNTTLALNPIIAFSAWIRFILYFFFFLVLKQEKNLRSRLILPFSLSLLLVIGLELAQTVKQSSLNGLFYFVGERNFSLATPNIAKLNFETQFFNIKNFLRPYSTFSHPNSLAGYLLICLLILKNLKPKHSLFKHLITFGIFLTFSKAAIITLLVLKLTSLNHFLKTKVILLTFFFVGLLPLFPLLSRSFNFSSSIYSRLYLGIPTLSIIKNYPVFGVGLNNFIIGLKNYLPPSQTYVFSLQPIHSLPLLLISEVGLLGLALSVYFFYKHKNTVKLPTNLLIVLAITGSVDHYWWTLTQNKLILVLFLALIIKHQFCHHKQ